jgi:hypothetical protein
MVIGIIKYFLYRTRVIENITDNSSTDAVILGDHLFSLSRLHEKHSDTPYEVGLLWTNDQTDAEAFT